MGPDVKAKPKLTHLPWVSGAIVLICWLLGLACDKPIQGVMAGAFICAVLVYATGSDA